ncbi:MAG: isochorismatase [Chloroflexota bacterium]|nr:isochorismatase [Chloroflexota bacterium]
MSAAEALTTRPRPSISPYAPRPIRLLELWRPEGWSLKVYGIAFGRPEPSVELVDAAKRLALETLPGDPGYGVGFVGAHQARAGCYVFVDWWGNENELYHRSFLGPSPAEMRPAGPDDSTACVWDLAVIDFERRAWHELVVKRSENPDVDGYLAQRFEELV